MSAHNVYFYGEPDLAKALLMSTHKVCLYGELDLAKALLMSIHNMFLWRTGPCHGASNEYPQHILL